MTVAADTTFARRHAVPGTAGPRRRVRRRGRPPVLDFHRPDSADDRVRVLDRARRSRTRDDRSAPVCLASRAVSLIAAGFSPDPRVSLMADKQMVLFLLVPLVYRFAAGPHASTLVTVIVTFAAVSAVVGIV